MPAAELYVDDTQTLSGSTHNSKLEAMAKLYSLDRVHSMIEFTLIGDILHANSNFLSIFGYSLDEPSVGRTGCCAKSLRQKQRLC